MGIVVGVIIVIVVLVAIASLASRSRSTESPGPSEIPNVGTQAKSELQTETPPFQFQPMPSDSISEPEPTIADSMDDPKIIHFTLAQFEEALLARPRTEEGLITEEEIVTMREELLAPYRAQYPGVTIEGNLNDLLEECKQGELVFDYEDSTMGDTDTCEVYCLSRSTALVLRTDTHEEFSYIVVSDWTPETLIQFVESKLTEGFDEEWEECYSPWDDMEWVHEEENTVRRTGMAELKENLNRTYAALK